MEWLKQEATLSNLNSMIDFVLDNLKEDIILPHRVKNQIRLLCEEVFMNVISHAYDNLDKGKGQIIIGYEFNSDKNCMLLKICDYGMRFNPVEEAEEPDIFCDIMERDVGGLGIFIIKKMSDFIDYERQRDMNILTIKKYL